MDILHINSQGISPIYKNYMNNIDEMMVMKQYLTIYHLVAKIKLLKFPPSI